VHCARRARPDGTRVAHPRASRHQVARESPRRAVWATRWVVGGAWSARITRRCVSTRRAGFADSGARTCRLVVRSVPTRDGGRRRAWGLTGGRRPVWFEGSSDGRGGGRDHRVWARPARSAAPGPKWRPRSGRSLLGRSPRGRAGAGGRPATAVRRSPHVAGPAGPGADRAHVVIMAAGSGVAVRRRGGRLLGGGWWLRGGGPRGGWGPCRIPCRRHRRRRPPSPGRQRRRRR
jgi:hypothetical protein